MRTCFLAALLALASACVEPRRSADETPPTVRRAGVRGLINPILDVEPTIEFRELRPFKHKVEKFVEDVKRSGRATHVSVYFRDLNNGRSSASTRRRSSRRPAC